MLHKRWNPPDDGGLVMMGEGGTFSSHEGVLSLYSHTGRQRCIAPAGEMDVITDAGDSDHMQLHGWQLLKSTG